MKKILSMKNENKLLIVLAFVSLSTGIWSKFRQLWLQDIGYSITDISKILSVALICSSILSFVISFFSTKIKIKHVVALSFMIRITSLIGLLAFRDDYIIKLCMLLCVMCDVIFAISYYPLLSFEARKDAYKRKMLIDYFFTDAGVVVCGLLLGVSIGNYIFDYNGCLVVSIVCALFGLLFLIPVNSHQKIKKSKSFKKSIKEIFTSRINRIFLYTELFGYIAFGIVFDLMMLILTNYIGFSVTFTSIFIIVSNMLATIFSYIFSKFSNGYSISLSSLIKYGSRVVVYIIAIVFNNNLLFIFAIIYAYITCRVLEDKVTGSFLELISNDNQFLFGNIRYFALSLGEGIGAFLAGLLLSHSLRMLFIGASIFTLIITLNKIYLDYLKRKQDNG